MPTQIVVAIDDQSNIDAWGLRPYGAWAAGTFPKGAVVTHSGSLWVAGQNTSQTPGVGSDWTILVPSFVGATGAMFPQGSWNATTNVPALASGVGTEGYVYRVSTAGPTTLDTLTDWNVGDLVVYLGGAWRKVRGHVLDAVDITDSTAAGRALLTGSVAEQRVSLLIDAATLVADVSQSVTSAMTEVIFTSLTAARDVSLPAASTFSQGQSVIIADESGSCSATNTITINRAGSDTINGGTSFVLDQPYAGVILVRASSGKWTALPLATYRAWVSAGVSVRQTVSTGPVTSDGLPNFLPATSGSLAVTSQNISASVPFMATAANGAAAAAGVVNRNGLSISNLTWSGLSANTTNYLYVTINADGTLTTGSTTLAPIYQQGGTPATTNGQFTFNVGEMKGYLGNGTTAPQAFVVFVGEALTGASSVTSTTAYAYRGLYTSTLQSWPATSSFLSLNHNIGMSSSNYSSEWFGVCQTSNLSYPVNSELPAEAFVVASGNSNPFFSAIAVDQNTSRISTDSSGSGALNSYGGSAKTNITASSWRLRLYARRRW